MRGRQKRAFLLAEMSLALLSHHRLNTPFIEFSFLVFCLFNYAVSTEYNMYRQKVLKHNYELWILKNMVITCFQGFTVPAFAYKH